MRRLWPIVLCLFLAGGAGAATAASAHHQGKRHFVQHLGKRQSAHHQGKRHKLCGKRHKRSKPCRPRKRNVSQTSGEPSAVALPPLADLIAPETACPGQSDESLPIAAQEATMGCMINFARRNAGMTGVAGVAPLNDSSDNKASDMILCGEFSHNACGRAFTYWLEQGGYAQPGGCWGAGENLGWGTGGLGAVRSVLTGWVYSPDHLANMLSAPFDEFGIGLQVGPLNGYPDAHVWVAHFGTRC